MKWTDQQIEFLIKNIFSAWKNQSIVKFRSSEEEALRKAKESIEGEFHKEVLLEKEVYKMMDDLEKKNLGSFERYKMFPLLKRRLAKEKGLIL